MIAGQNFMAVRPSMIFFIVHLYLNIAVYLSDPLNVDRCLYWIVITCSDSVQPGVGVHGCGVLRVLISAGLPFGALYLSDPFLQDPFLTLGRSKIGY